MKKNIQNPIIPKETAQTVLKPYLQALWNIINGAFEAWLELGRDKAHLWEPLSPYCRARFVYDHIVKRAKGEFDGKPGIRMEEKRGFLIVHIQNMLTIRFKKFDPRLRTSNIKTRQQTLFSMQMEMEGLPK